MKNSIIQRAEVWASSLWESSRIRWTVRSVQDRNYRSHVIHPALASLFDRLYPEGHIHVLDLGCGDGIFIEDNVGRKVLAEGGSYTGVDISADFIARDQPLIDSGMVSFIQGNLTDPGFPGELFSHGLKWNCVLSVFTIQEIPDLEMFMGNLKRIVTSGSPAIIITVHPEFAEWLRENGRLRLEENLEIPPEQGKADPPAIPCPPVKPGDNRGTEGRMPLWRWAGQYPIVDEPRKAFYLPYFHRIIHDYRLGFTQAGFCIEQVIELPEKNSDLPRLVREGISPFVPFETNLYWPRIAEVCSSVVFVIRKESKGEQR